MSKTGRGSEGQAPIEIACSVKHETERAWLITDGTKDVWLPKSQCEMDERAGICTMPEWLAKEKELI